jgi:hypothetical protein
MNEKRPQETEPFGITYDRIRVDRVLTRLVRQNGIRTALELPADGSKAMPGIYSLSLARAGAHVTLFNPEPQGLEVWDRLGLSHRVSAVYGDDCTRTELESGQFDLVWNFVSNGVSGEFEERLTEMSRLSNRWIVSMHMNGYNWGYPWHRFLHRVFDLEWTHGPHESFFPEYVKRCFRANGVEPTEHLLLDMPWWPDPPGFRDVRLHLEGRDDTRVADWTAPIEEVYRTGRMPLAGRILERIEDARIPRPVRNVFSHLFAIVGERILR